MRDGSQSSEKLISAKLRSTNLVPEATVFEFHLKRSKYVVLMPVWNQGDTLVKQLTRMQLIDHGTDIVLSDSASFDGSTDPFLLEQLGVRTLLVTEETGLATAIRLGLSYVLEQGYEGVIAIDGNGKDGVEAIPVFVEHLKRGFDFVQGSRFHLDGRHENTPWERLLGIRYCIAPLLSMACGFQFKDPTNGFKGMSRAFLTDSRLQPLRPVFKRFNLQFYLNYSAPRLGYRVIEIPVSRVYPRDLPTPTKIVGIRSKLVLFRDFLTTVLGCYNCRDVR